MPFMPGLHPRCARPSWTSEWSCPMTSRRIPAGEQGVSKTPCVRRKVGAGGLGELGPEYLGRPRLPLNGMNLDGDAGGVGDNADVVRVRGDHSVAAADGPLDHRHVDNVIMARA